jgi:hypothetical protein
LDLFPQKSKTYINDILFVAFLEIGNYPTVRNVGEHHHVVNAVSTRKFLNHRGKTFVSLAEKLFDCKDTKKGTSWELGVGLKRNGRNENI